LNLLEEERQNMQANSLVNKKLNESAVLPFIQANKIVSHYLNMKKIADIKNIVKENFKKQNDHSYSTSKDTNREERQCNL